MAEIGKAPDIAEAHTEPQHRQQELKHIHKHKLFVFERALKNKYEATGSYTVYKGAILDDRAGSFLEIERS